MKTFQLLAFASIVAAASSSGDVENVHPFAMEMDFAKAELDEEALNNELDESIRRVLQFSGISIPLFPPVPAPFSGQIPSAPVPVPVTIPVPAPAVIPVPPPVVVPAIVPVAPPTQAPTRTRCELPIEEYRAQVFNILAANVTAAPTLSTPGTPQNRAFNWLVNEDRFEVCPNNTKLVQRYAAGVFYYSTDGDNWRECGAPDDFSSDASVAEANANCNIPTGNETGDLRLAWLTPVNECDWAAIACNPNNLCALAIDFQANRLGGTLPTEIEQLMDLIFFGVQNGTTAGTLPSQYGNLENLRVIDVNFNRLVGSIPESYFDLTNLQQFDINGNFLTGTLSTEFGLFTDLRFFQAQDNLLGGTIPSQFGLLTNLVIGDFFNNNLVGTVSQEICNLRPPPADRDLTVLRTDCLEPNPEVVCTCCSGCF